MAITAAIVKEFLGIRFLEIFNTQFIGKNGRGDGDNRRPFAVGVVQTVDQMYVSGTTAARAASNTRHLRICFGGVCARFFMAHVDPLYASVTADGVIDGIEAVTCYSINSFHPGFY